ncbi:MAG: hypothetical protein K6A62_04730 [Bacteroidales bacterium]|nr:hypothetical protein [Bacteroidales bacterium]
MVTELGAGYQFMGVATPATNPGTPDQRVFYIAGPGTYPNFDAIVIGGNKIGVFRYDTQWHADTMTYPLADESVTTAKIADEAVTEEKLSTELQEKIVHPVDVQDSGNDADLDVSDENGNALARFKNGHFRVKNFDSAKNNANLGIDSVTDFSEDGNYAVDDIVKYGGLLYKFTEPHEAGEWDDTQVEQTNVMQAATHPVAVQDSGNDADLDVSDENGNVLARFKNGHFRTKNFDSSNVLTQKRDYLVPDKTIAFWDFTKEKDYLTDIVNGFTLEPNNVNHTNDGIYFNGQSSYMRIPNASVKNLDISKFGENVTIIALIQPNVISNGFIAGMWQENNNNPQREYGLFIDLPTYGGGRRVIGHISKTGGASPGIPYSRDYSATGRSIVNNRTSCIGMTYDGHIIKSYLDGITDSYIDYHESSLVYDKNPYVFNWGLNKVSTADFTVGANLLTSGMANFYNGYISKLIVIARCLDEMEMAEIAYFYAKNQPFATFPNPESNTQIINATQGGFKTRTKVGQTIMDNLSNANAVKIQNSLTESYIYVMPTNEISAIAYIQSKFIKLSQIKTITFSAKANTAISNGLRLVVKINTNWYASSAFAVSTTKTEKSLTISFDANIWYHFDYENVSIGNLLDVELPNGNIESMGILFDSIGENVKVEVSSINVNI